MRQVDYVSWSLLGVLKCGALVFIDSFNREYGLDVVA